MSDVIKNPTVDNLMTFSNKYRLQSTKEELLTYQELMTRWLADWSDSGLLAADSPTAVKYPRDIGHKPLRNENQFNAWCWKCRIVGASAGKLHGLRVAVKDNICVAGVPLTAGSKVMGDYVPEQDATIVTRMLDQGAVILGKSTTEKLCFSECTGGMDAVRNPWSPEHVPGGSSSGSAVLAATGEVDVAIGGDQGGSIRVPASCCGVVGLKPTHGLVPYTGILPMVTCLDHVGPMSKTVKQCALALEVRVTGHFMINMPDVAIKDMSKGVQVEPILYKSGVLLMGYNLCLILIEEVMAGFDSHADCRQPSIGYSHPEYSKEIDKPRKSFKLGILREGFYGCHSNVENLVRTAINMLQASKRFLAVEEISIPAHLNGPALWSVIGTVGLLNQFIDGAGYGTGFGGYATTSMSDALRNGLTSHLSTASCSLKTLILLGCHLRGNNMDSTLYCRAQNRALELRRQYDRMLNEYDVLLMPTLLESPAKFPVATSRISESISDSMSTIANTAIFNVTHHPALTLNAGFDATHNMPVGISLVGRHWDDLTVLQVAEIVEEILQPLQTRFLRR